MLVNDSATKLHWKSWSLSRHGRPFIHESHVPHSSGTSQIRHKFVERAEQLTARNCPESAQELTREFRDDEWMTAQFEVLTNRSWQFFNTGNFEIDEARNLYTIAGLLKWLGHVTNDNLRIARSLYFHSVLTGIIASKLNSEFSLGFRGEEFIAGLMHDIGRILLSVTTPERFIEYDDPDTFDGGAQLDDEFNQLGINHPEIGVWFLEKTDLPMAIHQVTRFHHHPENATDDQQLVRLISAADRMAFDLQPSTFVDQRDLRHAYEATDEQTLACVNRLGINDHLTRKKCSEIEETSLNILRDVSVSFANQEYST